MALRVQKFGGSSLADIAGMGRAAARVMDARRVGDRVVVVVSARGRTTDRLLGLAAEAGGCPLAPGMEAWADRDVDALLATGEQESAALMSLLLRRGGCPAASFAGWQAGILTDGRHREARVTAVAPDRLREALARGVTPVVTGFQGLTPDGDVSTLGRGGSDATAVVLAAALNADACEIYSDVDGVYTADPRLVPGAMRLPEISYDEMLEMARLGAKVLQHRAVEYARDHGVTIQARSTFADGPGTRVAAHAAREGGRTVSGVSLERDTARLVVSSLPAEPGAAARLFGQLAQSGVNVDMIVRSLPRQGVADLSFTVAGDDLDRAAEVSRAFAEASGAGPVLAERGLAKLSVVGAGMATRPGVASAVFRAVAAAGATVELVGTSDISISCLLRPDQAEEAVRQVHAAFFPAPAQA